MTTTLAKKHAAAKGLAAKAQNTAEQARDAMLAATPIQSADEADHTVETVRVLKKGHALITEERDAVSKPLRAQANANSKRWKPALDLLDEAIKGYSRLITVFEQTKIATAQVMLAAEASPTEIQAVVKLVAPRAAGSHQVTTWSAEVIDFAALSDEYKLPDMTKLNALARKQHAAMDVAGAKAVPSTRTDVKA